MTEGGSIKEKASNSLRLRIDLFEDVDDLSKPSTSSLDDFSDSYSDYSSEFDTKKPKKSRRAQINLKDIKLYLNCEWKECNFETSSMPLFITHVSNHIPQVGIKKNQENTETYVCLWNDCNFDTENDKELSRHINYHSYHTKLKYLGSRMITHWNSVRDCRINLYGKNNLPDLSSEFVCLWENCLNVFTHTHLFYGHVRLHGVGSLDEVSNKIVNCKWLGCKATFKSEKLLIVHLKSHTQEKTIACPECGAFFTSTTKLYDHLVRQSDDLQYQCKLCSKYFATTRLLREHMRIHINNYKCIYCDMTCPKPHLLSRHILTFHLDIKPFKCEFCEYKSNTQQHINIHILTHYSHNNYQCTEAECDFTCRSAYGLRSHFDKKHGKGRKLLYSCHLCEERFVRGAYLTKHLTSVHLIKNTNKNRLRYKLDEDGLYRLQTVRYTSWEGVEEIDCSKETENDNQNTEKINNRPVLISIEEMDENGEIVRSDTLETHVISELPSNNATIL